jgi:hypothetical protein
MQECGFFFYYRGNREISKHVWLDIGMIFNPPLPTGRQAFVLPPLAGQALQGGELLPFFKVLSYDLIFMSKH